MIDWIWLCWELLIIYVDIFSLSLIVFEMNSIQKGTISNIWRVLFFIQFQCFVFFSKMLIFMSYYVLVKKITFFFLFFFGMESKSLPKLQDDPLSISCLRMMFLFPCYFTPSATFLHTWFIICSLVHIINIVRVMV